jgi:hypothetical protein
VLPQLPPLLSPCRELGGDSCVPISPRLTLIVRDDTQTMTYYDWKRQRRRTELNKEAVFFRHISPRMLLIYYTKNEGFMSSGLGHTKCQDQ